MKQFSLSLNSCGISEDQPARWIRAILSFSRFAKIIALLGLSALSPAVLASDELTSAATSAISVDQIALELSNPVTAVRSIAFDFEYRTYQGDLPGIDGETESKLVITPSWPIRLSNGKNILLRATIPVIGKQPLWQRVWWNDYAEFLVRQRPDSRFATGEITSSHGHLDDVGFNVGYGGVNESGFISMFGLASVFPTSSDGTASRGQYLLGPEIALGKVTNWGQIGAQAKHLINIGNDDNYDPWDTKETTVKIFFAYGLGNGWQIESNPIILYDWEAVSGNEWLVPIGAGISKTILLGSLPLKMGFEIQKFVVSPDRFGPDWFLRVSFTPVISTKLLN